MGQPVVVVEKPSRRPGIVRFEANRSLSGMGHDSFTAGDASGVFARANTPAAELARRLFATGRVAGVHVYQNMVTVDLNKGFQYWWPKRLPRRPRATLPRPVVRPSTVASRHT